jgi:hypothetical protein
MLVCHSIALSDFAYKKLLFAILSDKINSWLLLTQRSLLGKGDQNSNFLKFFA